MTRDDLFNTNAGIVKTLVEGCAEFCPDAVLAIISNPVNSTVPIAAEILAKRGVYNPKKVCGVTTLDVLRANTFVGNHLGKDPAGVNVTVIGVSAGSMMLTLPCFQHRAKAIHSCFFHRFVSFIFQGHAGTTILPLFSQVSGFNPSPADLEALTVRTQFGGDEVVKAKAGSGSATLSMAYAGYLFTENVVKALQGEQGIVQCAYVQSSLTDSKFFASPCKFGKDGIEEVLGFGQLSAYEKQWFDKMLPDLKKQIAKGVEFANGN
jgi:malate dehydrogenase